MGLVVETETCIDVEPDGDCQLQVQLVHELQRHVECHGRVQFLEERAHVFEVELGQQVEHRPQHDYQDEHFELLVVVYYERVAAE